MAEIIREKRPQHWLDACPPADAPAGHVKTVAQALTAKSVTERCVMKLSPEGLVVTEVAPGIDIREDILGRAEMSLTIAPDVKLMADELFRPEKFGLKLAG